MPGTEIQWFPGHMAKTRRELRESLPLVDLVIELLDARIPYSSRNPDIRRLTDGKPLLTVFTKTSLADPVVTDKWRAYFAREGGTYLFLDAVTGAGYGDLMPTIRTLLADKLAKYEEKGMTGRRIKAMVVGIPNVGKSSLINRLMKRTTAKAENRPGVTRTRQWFQTSIGLDLLDTPGILWPKFEERRVGEHLAITGAVRDQILDTEAIAMRLCAILRERYPDLFTARYKLSADDIVNPDVWELFLAVGRRRGFLIPGGEVNTERTAAVLLEEFRSAKIGRCSLEAPSC